MLSKNEVKVIKSLKIKKYRLREKRFLVEGAKNVQELLNSRYKMELLVCTRPFMEVYPGMQEQVRVECVSEKQLATLGHFVSNNTCLAVVRIPVEEPAIDFSRQLFALDGISDPGNLGTIIRTLDWFGFDQLVCSPDSAELYNPKVISSTMGSFTRVNVWYQALSDVLTQAPLPSYGADMEGSSLFRAAIPQPSIIVMGNESGGITAATRDHLDHFISIPGSGKAESLNVGVATGIIAGHLRSAMNAANS